MCQPAGTRVQHVDSVRSCWTREHGLMPHTRDIKFNMYDSVRSGVGGTGAHAARGDAEHSQTPHRYKIHINYLSGLAFHVSTGDPDAPHTQEILYDTAVGMLLRERVRPWGLWLRSARKHRKADARRGAWRGDKYIADPRRSASSLALGDGR